MKKLFTYICVLNLLIGNLPSFSLAQNEPIVINTSSDKSEKITPSAEEDVQPASESVHSTEKKRIEQDIQLFKVDGKEVEFETKPIVINQSIMVPMKEFFQALGCNVKWINDTKEVIAYKNNMFIKLQLNNLTAYKNGKGQTLKEPPMARNGKTLVPADFIAETFDMNIDYNAIKQAVEMTSTSSANKYTILSNSFFKEQIINDFGVSISTPTFWNKKEGLDNTFEYQDDFEYYQLIVNKQDIDNTLSLNRFTELHKAKLLEIYGEALSFNGKSVLRTENFDMNVVYLTTTIENEERNQILYFVTANGTGYIITCSYGLYVNEEDAMDLFNNVLSTFQVNNLTLNAEEEHYFEFDPYFENNFNLETEIYSNMSIDNSIVIKGSLKKGHNIHELKAIVSKDKERLEFPIEMEDNTFSGTIYLPFGLGKHNVIIAGIPKDATVAHVGQPVTVYVNDNVAQIEQVTETSEEIEEKTELTAEEELEEIKALTEKLNQQNADNNPPSTTTNSLTATEDTEDSLTGEASNDLIKDASEDLTAIEEVEKTSNDIIDDTDKIEFDNIEQYYIMKFSIVNLSNDKIRYKIPSRLINSDSMDLYNTANYITYKNTFDYAKSRTLFQWISENVEIVTANEKNLEPRTSLEILQSKTATQEEIPILYCALLRSLNIPSRVMVGHFDGEVSYWTEILLNGTWIVSNPTWEILYRDELTKNKAYTNYFNIYRPSHYGTFENIDLLPY